MRCFEIRKQNDDGYRGPRELPRYWERVLLVLRVDNPTDRHRP